MNGTFPLWTYWTDGNHITRFKIQDSRFRIAACIWSGYLCSHLICVIMYGIFVNNNGVANLLPFFGLPNLLNVLGNSYRHRKAAELRGVGWRCDLKKRRVTVPLCARAYLVLRAVFCEVTVGTAEVITSVMDLDPVGWASYGRIRIHFNQV